MTTAEDQRVTAGVEQAKCDHARNMRDDNDNEDCGEPATHTARAQAWPTTDVRYFCARHASGWNRSLRGADISIDNWIVTRIGVTP